GAVPSAQLTADLRVDRQRQKARRRGNPVFLDDNGAVVQGGSGGKNRHQQIVGQHRIERNAALDVIPQPNLALDRDDGPDLLRRQHRGGDDDLLDGLVGRLLAVEVTKKRRLTEVRQRATYVRLKNDDGRKCYVEQHVADKPVHGLQRS